MQVTSNSENEALRGAMQGDDTKYVVGEASVAGRQTKAELARLEC